MTVNKQILFFLIIALISFDAFGQVGINGIASIKVSSLTSDKQKITCKCPSGWNGYEIKYQIGTEYKNSKQLSVKDDLTHAEFIVDATRDQLHGKPFLVFINDFPLVAIHSIYEYVSTTNNIRNSAEIFLSQIKLFAAEVGTEDDWILSILISQKESMLSLLQKLSESNLKDGNIYLMVASHQDTGWEDTPMQCEEDRGIKIITPAIDLLKENKDYLFNVENMLSLMEYINRNPQKKDDIYKLTKEGRLTWGATYNQPYEEMYSGESLARQFYFGRKWLKDNFPGLDTYTAWNVDVPGRTHQSAQLMAKAGVKYLIISRHQQGLFEWQSPDGSKVKVYSPGDYGETWRQLQRNPFRAFRHIAEFSLEYQKYNENSGNNAVIPFMANKDMSPPYLYRDVINHWNNLSYWEESNGEKIFLQLPKIEYSTPEHFFKKLEENNPVLPIIQGERPNVWVYIHAPSHHNLLTAIREGSILLTSAEKFATFNSLMENNWNIYPQKLLNNAWENHIYPDHGMGGKNGHITDEIFLEKAFKARNIADSILNSSIMSISQMIDFKNTPDSYPIVIFNSISRQRTDQAKVTLDLKKDFHFKIVDAQHKNIPFQIISENNEGNIKKVEIMFLAENIPSLGFKTYYVVPSDKDNSNHPNNDNQITYLENDFYKIELGNGGVKQIFDKELNRELLNTTKFSGGELFSMKSEGTGAGEFAQIQQPTMHGFEKMSDYKTNWGNYENGPVYQSVELIQKIKHAEIRQKIILYNQTKKINFDISLLKWEGIQFREFRLAFPINMENAEITYEVPFGKVTIGKDEIEGCAGERYTVNASDIRPRGILNWIGINDEKSGITISSSVGVWDYIDPTDEPADYPILQPVLLASRRSRHHEGNWYLQEGDHHFSFSFTSHSGNWDNGYHKALEHNEPLMSVFNPERKKSLLPLELSFLNIDKSNVSVSTVKKSDNSNDVIIRLYETEGINTPLNLNSYFTFKNITECNLIEEEKSKLSNKSNIEIGKFAVETFKTNFKNK